MAFGKQDIPGYKGKCSRCGKTFEGLPFPPTEGKPVWCRDCVHLMHKMTEIVSTLLKQEFFLEQEDAKIAQDIQKLISKENLTKADQDAVDYLVERLIQDEDKKKNILNEIKKLQKK